MPRRKADSRRRASSFEYRTRAAACALTGEFSGSTVTFTRARFSGGAISFYLARFSGSAVDFSDTMFSGGTVDFWARFSGGTVDFSGAEFSCGEVDFSRAYDWSVPPEFPQTNTAPPGGEAPGLERES
jgi:hypothetical protein